MWAIKQDYHASGAIEVFEQDGVPVLISHLGRYPTAVAEDGRSTEDVPHIEIKIGGGSVNGVEYFSSVFVIAVGTYHNGRRRGLKVFGKNEPGLDHSLRRPRPDEWVALGKTKIADAKDVLLSIDARFETAEAVIARAWEYGSRLSRSDYEAACAACQVEALSDEACMGYGVRFGDFGFPEYPAEHVAKMHLAHLRMAQLVADAAPPPPTQKAPKKLVREGQLWEECERCGAEPVFMPLHLCDRCWPKEA